MRMWTMSACVVLACIILLMPTAGMRETAASAQASIRTERTTHVTVSTASLAVPAVTAAGPAVRYAVQPGDTLSGIAARFAVPGGWPALYAANRSQIGPEPDLIRPGTVLVLPGHSVPAQYTVSAGDTLSGIAARFAVPGGWPALYAANRTAIGPDPDMIHDGTVLVLPQEGVRAPAARSAQHSRPVPPAPGRAHRRPSAHRAGSARPSAPAGRRHQVLPTRRPHPQGAGMPGWLKAMLLAVGLLIVAAFLIEPALAAFRRRRKRVRLGDPRPPLPCAGSAPPPTRVTQDRPRIIEADYQRLVVTHCTAENAIYVLRPPETDPRAILKVARLVLAEDLYAELAIRLGLPASWPIVLADHHRVVVTCSQRDGTVYVLRPPGEDPMAVLRAARLVLPEDPYEELADHLGVPGVWPL
jgi:LysM repeat protein